MMTTKSSNVVSIDNPASLGEKQDIAEKSNMDIIRDMLESAIASKKEYPINLDEVWVMFQIRKDSLVRIITKDFQKGKYPHTQDFQFPYIYKFA
jgi:hypothetical protein